MNKEALTILEINYRLENCINQEKKYQEKFDKIINIIKERQKLPIESFTEEEDIKMINYAKEIKEKLKYVKQMKLFRQSQKNELEREEKLRQIIQYKEEELAELYKELRNIEDKKIRETTETDNQSEISTQKDLMINEEDEINEFKRLIGIDLAEVKDEMQDPNPNQTPLNPPRAQASTSDYQKRLVRPIFFGGSFYKRVKYKDPEIFSDKKDQSGLQS